MASDLLDKIEYTYMSLKKVSGKMKKDRKNIVLASSFGEYSAVPLHFVDNIPLRIPLIHVRLYSETEETKRHREELFKRFHFPVIQIYEEGEDKAETFKNALKSIKADKVIMGTRKYETKNRENFEDMMYDEDLGIYRIHPFLDWTKDNLEEYLRRNDLPKNENHYDSNKGEYQKLECGVNVFGEGKRIRIN